MATDQEIREAGYYYIPPQEYLADPFKIPAAPEAPEDPDGGQHRALTHDGRRLYGRQLLRAGEPVGACSNGIQAGVEHALPRHRPPHDELREGGARWHVHPGLLDRGHPRCGPERPA